MIPSLKRPWLLKEYKSSGLLRPYHDKYEVKNTGLLFVFKRGYCVELLFCELSKVALLLCGEAPLAPLADMWLGRGLDFSKFRKRAEPTHFIILHHSCKYSSFLNSHERLQAPLLLSTLSTNCFWSYIQLSRFLPRPTSLTKLRRRPCVSLSPPKHHLSR